MHVFWFDEILQAGNAPARMRRLLRASNSTAAPVGSLCCDPDRRLDDRRCQLRAKYVATESCRPGLCPKIIKVSAPSCAEIISVMPRSPARYSSSSEHHIAAAKHFREVGSTFRACGAPSTRWPFSGDPALVLSTRSPSPAAAACPTGRQCAGVIIDAIIPRLGLRVAH